MEKPIKPYPAMVWQMSVLFYYILTGTPRFSLLNQDELLPGFVNKIKAEIDEGIKLDMDKVLCGPEIVSLLIDSTIFEPEKRMELFLFDKILKEIFQKIQQYTSQQTSQLPPQPRLNLATDHNDLDETSNAKDNYQLAAIIENLDEDSKELCKISQQKMECIGEFLNFQQQLDQPQTRKEQQQQLDQLIQKGLIRQIEKQQQWCIDFENKNKELQSDKIQSYLFNQLNMTLVNVEEREKELRMQRREFRQQLEIFFDSMV